MGKEEEEEEEEERRGQVAWELLLLRSILVIYVDRSEICTSCRLLSTCEATMCQRKLSQTRKGAGLGPTPP